ncbi:MAG: hypothetical protein IT198_06515 [Acidimicrobiia bacterium]|nr:hypothetical protein [Acidimicrobiia bacterium]
MERKLWTPGGDVPVGKRDSGAPAPAGADEAHAGPHHDHGVPPELTEEQVAEIRAALEQLKQIPVEELILNEINTLAQVAQLHLQPGELDQSRLAIDAVRALTAAAGDRFPPELHAQLDELMSQLQLAYVQVASAARGDAGAPGGDAGGSSEA